MKIIVIGGISVLAAWVALAGEVDIPNQFQADTPAVAAEVNDNFAALEVAVDDNAQGIVDLQNTLGTSGVAVKIDGAVIGRYLGHGQPAIAVDIAAAVGIPGTVLVGESVNLSTSGRINVISPTGYRFSIATSDFEEPPQLSEGKLDFAPIFYDGGSCMGNTYFPVEGDTGFFSAFEPGSGAFRPVKRWAFRQGVVIASPDPDDVTPMYMIRSGQTAQTVPLRSLLVWAALAQPPQSLCVEAGNLPGFDINDPNDVNHSAFAIEPADAVETGVADALGGQITVGL